jgi:diguanylate cyclase (GGDEF)-like protein
MSGVNRGYILVSAVIWTIGVGWLYRGEWMRHRAGLVWGMVWILGICLLWLWTLHRETCQKMLNLHRGVPLMDDLTGLNNRRAFLALTHHQLDLAEKTEESGVLVIMKLNNLALIIDSKGQEEGDRVMILMAQAVLSSFRGSDVVARYDYDRFTAFLPRSTLVHRDQIIQRFNENLLKLDAGFNSPGGYSVKIGLTQFDPVAPASLERLIVLAKEDMRPLNKHRPAEHGP